MDVSLGLCRDGYTTRRVNVRVGDMRQHPRRDFIPDIATDQRIHGREQQILRRPTQGVESQGESDRRTVGLHRALVTGDDMRTVEPQDLNIARAGNDLAVGDVSLGLTENEVGGNDTAHRQPCPVAAGGGCRAVELGFDHRRLASIDTHRTRIHIGAQHIGMGLTAHIVADHHAAHRHRARLGLATLQFTRLGIHCRGACPDLKRLDLAPEYDLPGFAAVGLRSQRGGHPNARILERDVLGRQSCCDRCSHCRISCLLRNTGGQIGDTLEGGDLEVKGARPSSDITIQRETVTRRRPLHGGADRGRQPRRLVDDPYRRQISVSQTSPDKVNPVGVLSRRRRWRDHLDRVWTKNVVQGGGDQRGLVRWRRPRSALNDRPAVEQQLGGGSASRAGGHLSLVSANCGCLELQVKRPACAGCCIKGDRYVTLSNPGLDRALDAGCIGVSNPSKDQRGRAPGAHGQRVGLAYRLRSPDDGQTLKLISVQAQRQQFDRRRLDGLEGERKHLPAPPITRERQGLRFRPGRGGSADSTDIRPCL